MKYKTIVFGIFLLLSHGAIASNSVLDVTVITPEDRARLCAKPDCPSNKALIKLPTGIKLKTLTRKTIKRGMMKATWYKVSYMSFTGWISEYDLRVDK